MIQQQIFHNVATAIIYPQKTICYFFCIQFLADCKRPTVYLILWQDRRRGIFLHKEVVENQS